MDGAGLKTITATLLLFASMLIGLNAADKWIKGSNGQISGASLLGGYENGHDLVLCAGYYKGTYHPGKIVGENCNYGYGGKEILSNQYYTLNVPTSNLQRYKWLDASNGNIPSVPGMTPIAVGFEGDRTLYVCRAAYMGGMHPGKIVGENCNFGYGGNEITLPDYQVLMYKQ